MIVSDVRATSAFYCQVLDFRLVMSQVCAGDGRLGWALLRRGAAEVMLHDATALPGLPPARHAAAHALRLPAHDLDALCAAASTHVAEPPHTTPYGTRECTIIDPNGVHLIFVAPQPALRRAA